MAPAMRRLTLLVLVALLAPAGAERRQAQAVAQLRPDAPPAVPRPRVGARRLLSSAAVLLVTFGGGRASAQGGWFSWESVGKLVQDTDAWDTASAFYQKFIQRADLDGDGGLSPVELEYFGHLAMDALMASTLKAFEVPPEALGVGRSMAEDDEAMAMFKELDLNGDGLLDKQEVIEAVRSFLGTRRGELVGRRIEKWVDLVFERADVSGDGLLSPQEAEFFRYLVREVTVATAFGQQGAEYLDEERRRGLVSGIFKEFDKNGDGKIDIADIIDLYKG